MALYDYKCGSCASVFEVYQSMKSRRRAGFKCRECGSCKTVRMLSMARVGAIVGSGDTTNILKSPDGSPYRLKAGTVADQKKEILRELNRQEDEKIARGEINPRFRLNYEVNR